MYRACRAYDDKSSVGIFGAQYHTLRIDAAQATHGQVGDEAYLTAYKILGVVVFGNAGDDGATIGSAVVDAEFEQFVCLGHTLAGLDGTYTKVCFHKGVEVYIRLLGRGFPRGNAIGFADILKALELLLYGLVLDFLEKEFGCSDFRPAGIISLPRSCH